MLALIGEGEAEKFVDGVFRFRSEATQQRATAAFGSQDFGIKLKRRDKIGAGEPRRKPVSGAAQYRAGISAQPQPVPQGFLVARIAEAEQRLFVDIEKRAFQHRRQGQIVLGQQQKAPERHQILHRELLGQHQAVGTGHRDTVPLQCPQ